MAYGSPGTPGGNKSTPLKYSDNRRRVKYKKNLSKTKTKPSRYDYRPMRRPDRPQSPPYGMPGK